jgi:hypothetical protein
VTTQNTTNAPRSPTSEATGGVGYLALVLAWLAPGLGHFVIGQKIRGVIFALTIHGLFALGMLLGGIRAINPPEQQIWTYTQFLTGWPMLVANRIEHDWIKRPGPAIPSKLDVLQRQYEQNRPPVGDESRREERRQYAENFIKEHPVFAYHPKVQDIGAVYCGIAGMLNLLVMFDVLLRITGSQREVPANKPASGKTRETGASA